LLIIKLQIASLITTDGRIQMKLELSVLHKRLELLLFNVCFTE